MVSVMSADGPEVKRVYEVGDIVEIGRKWYNIISFRLINVSGEFKKAIPAEKPTNLTKDASNSAE